MEKVLAAVACVLLFSSWPVFAQLSATVTPGYQFGASERPTATTLNQLGQPTIAISGTIGGSVGLTAGSVTGTHLASSVADGVTLTFTNTSPQALKIKDGGVSTNQISTNIAGVGLTGGAGSALTLTETVITNISIPASATVVTNNHSLTRLPRQSRAVLVCTNSDLAYAVGDEVDLFFVTRTNFVQVHQLVADSTKIYLMLASASAASTSTAWQMRRKDTALFADLATNKWLIKIYARP